MGTALRIERIRDIEVVNIFCIPFRIVIANGS